MSAYRDFIAGFARGADLDYREAETHWAAWSVQLSDSERTEIERQGQDSGFTEGQKFHEFFSDDWRERREAFSNEGGAESEAE